MRAKKQPKQWIEKKQIIIEIPNRYNDDVRLPNHFRSVALSSSHFLFGLNHFLLRLSLPFLSRSNDIGILFMQSMISLVDLAKAISNILANINIEQVGRLVMIIIIYRPRTSRTSNRNGTSQQILVFIVLFFLQTFCSSIWVMLSLNKNKALFGTRWHVAWLSRMIIPTCIFNRSYYIIIRVCCRHHQLLCAHKDFNQLECYCDHSKHENRYEIEMCFISIKRMVDWRRDRVPC